MTIQEELRVKAVSVRKELRKELEQWARENNFLAPNQQLTVTFQMSVKEKKVEPYPRNKTYPRYKIRLSRPLDDRDWNIILKADFTQKQRRLAEIFKASGNKPMLPSEMATSLEDRVSFAFCDSLNIAFRKAKAPYRFLRAVPAYEDAERRTSSYWGKHSFKFVAIEL